MFTDFNYTVQRLRLNRAIISSVCIILSVFFYSCEKEIFVESKSSEQTYYCSAHISSNPKGAQIYVDGKYSGRNTPDTVTFLTAGEHVLRLRFNSVMDTTFKIQADYSTIKSAYIDYLATYSHYGNIYCNSMPVGSYIYLDGQYTSKFTPDTLKYLLPGTYKVKLEQFRYRSDSVMVTVTGSTLSKVNMRLQDTTEWLDYRVNNSGIPSNKIVCFKVDMNNTIWIGTFDNGLSRLISGKFKNFNMSNSGLPSNFISCMDIDENDHVWVGTINGAAEFDGAVWKVYNAQSGLPSDNVTTIFCNHAGKTYVGTDKGLGLIESGEASGDIRINAPLLSKPISAVTGKKDGTLWVGSVGGITSCINDEWRTFTRANDGLLGFDAGYMDTDIDGNVWCSFPANYALGVGITGGLMKYDGTRWSEFPLPAYIKGKIQRVYADLRGNVWLGTPAGVYMLFPDNTFAVFASKEYAMATYNAMDVLVDMKYKVWFALWEGGVVKCKLKLL